MSVEEQMEEQAARNAAAETGATSRTERVKSFFTRSWRVVISITVTIILALTIHIGSIVINFGGGSSEAVETPATTATVTATATHDPNANVYAALRELYDSYMGIEAGEAMLRDAEVAKDRAFVNMRNAEAAVVEAQDAMEKPATIAQIERVAAASDEWEQSKTLYRDADYIWEQALLSVEGARLVYRRAWEKAPWTHGFAVDIEPPAPAEPDDLLIPDGQPIEPLNCQIPESARQGWLDYWHNLYLVPQEAVAAIVTLESNWQHCVINPESVQSGGHTVHASGLFQVLDYPERIDRIRSVGLGDDIMDIHANAYLGIEWLKGCNTWARNGTDQYEWDDEGIMRDTFACYHGGRDENRFAAGGAWGPRTQAYAGNALGLWISLRGSFKALGGVEATPSAPMQAPTAGAVAEIVYPNICFGHPKLDEPCTTDRQWEAGYWCHVDNPIGICDKDGWQYQELAKLGWSR